MHIGPKLKLNTITCRFINIPIKKCLRLKLIYGFFMSKKKQNINITTKSNWPLINKPFRPYLFKILPLIIEAKSCPKARNSIRILESYSSLLVTKSIICLA
jgi:hypothetical protein